MSTLDLLTNPALGQIAASVRWELLDQSNSIVDSSVPIDASSAPRIDNRINREVKRSLDGVVLAPDVLADINLQAERLRPVVVMADGTEHEQGVYVFSDTSSTVATNATTDLGGGPDLEAQWGDPVLLDQGATLKQGSGGITFYAPGDSIYTALTTQLEARGFPEYEVDPISSVFGQWVAWRPNEEALTIIYDLCALGGWYSLYFNNHGTPVAKQVPDLEAADPTLVYDIGAGIVRGSVIKSDDTLSAPNRYVVVNSSFTDAPIWGVWDVPAGAPHSFQSIGYRRVKEFDVQGMETNAEATRMAKALGQEDASTRETYDAKITPDPRHDTFDIVSFMGAKFRSQGYTLSLDLREPMDLELARTWSQVPEAIPR